MVQAKPESVKDYTKWLREELDIELTERTKNYYESVSDRILASFGESPLWYDVLSNLTSHNQTYYLDTGYYLFINPDSPELVTKPYESFIHKTFRKNVIYNAEWPAPPKDGWIVPNNWFERINDIVRTCVVVKYLDGVSYFVGRLGSACRNQDVDFRVDYEAKEEGYYAAHFYVDFRCEIPGENWDTTLIDACIEIQITTQLQEVIRKLLHKYYESRRGVSDTTGVMWQWDYASDEFSANYLGHILHYVEGMIMDVRKRAWEETSE